MGSSNKALQTGEQEFVNNNNKGVISFYRWQDDQVFLIVCNIGNQISEITIPVDTISKSMVSEIKPMLEPQYGNAAINEENVKIVLQSFGYGIWQVQ